MPALQLTANSSLPADGFVGTLAGRIWRPDQDGPSVAAIRADGVFDVSRAFPIMRDLCETEDPAAALRAGRIGGAGFDVLSVEPPHAGNPLLELRLPNFVLTPHVAWASAQAMQGLADQLIDNLESFVAGTPRNVVT